ncbi:MAG: T9SS type A sorting domain-containing protein [Fibrobacterota bacterium]
MRAFIILILIFSFQVFSKAYSPKILTQHTADLSGDYQNFLEHPGFSGKTGQELAEAVHNYFADSVTGFYHFADAREENRWVDNKSDYSSNERVSHLLIRDPIELFNSYGYGLCFHVNPAYAGMLEATGMFDSLVCGGYGSWHTMIEVHYDGDWHYFDPEQRGYVKEADGHIPSWLEIGENPSIMDNNPHGIFPYFPYPDSLKDVGMITLEMFKNFADTSYQKRNNNPPYYERYNKQWYTCHTMDFVLRRGESLRRYWQSDSQRVFMIRERLDTENENSYWAARAQELEEIHNKEPYGPKPWVAPENGGSVNTTGIGVLKYQPDLSYESDYSDGIFRDSNIVFGTEGPVLENDGSGFIIFRTYSPYLFIGKPGADLADLNGYHDGVVLSYQTSGNTTVQFSKNFGHSWTELASGADLSNSEDLTSECYGMYEYLVKFSFVGTAGQAGLNSFNTETWLSVAPMSLPRLKTGTNTIGYLNGDVKGMNTVPVRYPVILNDSAHTNPMIESFSGTYKPYDLMEKVYGDITFKIEAPENSSFKWFNTAASYSVLPWTSEKDYNISVSNDGNSYSLAYDFVKSPSWTRHWLQYRDTTGILNGYGNEFFIKFHGNSHAVNEVMIHAAYQEQNSFNDPVNVRYCYEENGMEKTYEFQAASASERSLDITGTVKNKYIELSVPNSSVLSISKDNSVNPEEEVTISAFPNPFNPSVKIIVSGKDINAPDSRINIMNTKGRILKTFVPNKIPYSFTWTAEGMSSGIYIAKFQNKEKSVLKKILMQK